MVKDHNLYNAESINAVKCDLVNEEIPFPKASAEFCLFLFVLSAITPDKFQSVI